MYRYMLLIMTLLLSVFASSVGFAACPVGVGVGGTWCENHYKWKCEKCGSEYCPIMQPGKCLRLDERIDVTEPSQLLKHINAAPQTSPAYSRVQ